MASVSKLVCMYSALVLHDDEVMVTEDKINGLTNTDIRSLICNIEVGGITLAAGAATTGSAAPAAGAAPAEQKKDKLRKESEESDGDMGFGLLD
ncbi:large ribosomal subunit protein P1-like [Notamacropus eugenii]|uniref:large ribosomal subunit protein P1-like n=1 Tax=Notamacropus eugenii TaxID=9315 RepID=UPI003B674807